MLGEHVDHVGADMICRSPSGVLAVLVQPRPELACEVACRLVEGGGAVSDAEGPPLLERGRLDLADLDGPGAGPAAGPARTTGVKFRSGALSKRRDR